MLKAIVVAGALALAAPAAAPAQSANSPAALAEAFFTQVQAGEVLKAYQDMWRGSAIMDKKQADVENIAAQNQAILRSYGKVLGWELMSEKVIAPSLVERLYLLRTENVPLFYKVQFYRPGTKWIVGNIYFTDTYKNVEE
ncbi:MAG TPA: hypothetical protein VF495_11635, partial [Phenylobacterium sp.]|jgi:hypothetical protein